MPLKPLQDLLSQRRRRGKVLRSPPVLRALLLSRRRRGRLESRRRGRPLRFLGRSRSLRPLCAVLCAALGLRGPPLLFALLGLVLAEPGLAAACRFLPCGVAGDQCPHCVAEHDARRRRAVVKDKFIEAFEEERERLGGLAYNKSEGHGHGLAGGGDCGRHEQEESLAVGVEGSVYLHHPIACEPLC